MLSLQEIARIADLARLELPEAAAREMQQQLNGILQMVDCMSELDTSNVEPMSHPQQMMQPLREDAVTETDSRELFQAIAPAVEDGLYLVPKVIE